MRKGSKHSKETLEKLRISHLGQIPWHKGKHLSEETKRKLSIGSKLRGYAPPKKYWFKIKNGNALLHKIIKENFKYRQWRSDVFTRDNFTCQYCGRRGGELSPHHIKSFKSILEENNINNLQQALDCEELWNINNGQTLCHKCHRKTDSYGLKWKKGRKL